MGGGEGGGGKRRKEEERKEGREGGKGKERKEGRKEEVKGEERKEGRKYLLRPPLAPSFILRLCTSSSATEYMFDCVLQRVEDGEGRKEGR